MKRQNLLLTGPINQIPLWACLKLEIGIRLRLLPYSLRRLLL